jgi:hypothetical protein
MSNNSFLGARHSSSSSSMHYIYAVYSLFKKQNKWKATTALHDIINQNHDYKNQFGCAGQNETQTGQHTRRNDEAM